MVATQTLSAEKRAYIAYLAKDKCFSTTEICKRTGVSPATVYRIKNQRKWRYEETISKGKGGRPKKLSARDERQIVRSLKALRRETGNFSSIKIMKNAGLCRSQLSGRTVRRCLNQKGYYSLQARKKGLLYDSDRSKRVEFTKRMIKHYRQDVWLNKVAFFLDGVSFTFKRHPKDQARAPRGRIWRKKNEGLKQGCTAKGSKEGSGGNLLKLLVATSYDEGVIECFEYDHLDGAVFASFVKERFPRMFKSSGKLPSRMFVQDNAPNQNSARVRGALRRVKAKQLKIPPRSGDINPIENLFKRVKEELHKQAIDRNIEKETFQQFKVRVIDTLFQFPIHEINNTIGSMHKRLNMIIESKGDRTKY